MLNSSEGHVNLSCNTGAVRRSQSKNDFTESVNDWAGRTCVCSGVERRSLGGTLKRVNMES